MGIFLADFFRFRQNKFRSKKHICLLCCILLLNRIVLFALQIFSPCKFVFCPDFRGNPFHPLNCEMGKI